jgi:DNA-binding CsgD family transcriptional regulator
VATGHSGGHRVPRRAGETRSGRRKMAGEPPQQLRAGELVSLLRGLVDSVTERPPAPPEDLPVALDIEVNGLWCLVVVEAPGRMEGTLSPREEEIAAMVGLGYPNKTIAANLGISSWTVSTHLRRMFAKFGVRSRAALVAAVLEERRVSDEHRAFGR